MTIFKKLRILPRYAETYYKLILIVLFSLPIYDLPSVQYVLVKFTIIIITLILLFSKNEEIVQRLKGFYLLILIMCYTEKYINQGRNWLLVFCLVFNLIMCLVYNYGDTE